MKGPCGKNKRRIAVIAVLLALVVFWVVSLNSMKLTVTHYRIETEKLSADWKVALLSDLHNQEYGEGNSQLIQQIREYAPDTILICGDMVVKDDPDVTVVLELCRELVKIADVYYLYGNHEGVLQYDPNGLRIPLDQYLTELGVILLYGGLYEIRHEDDTIALFAKSINAKEYRESEKSQSQAAEFLEQEGFKLAMSHFPNLFYDALADAEFDLAVAGHYHGGQIILPGIGGVYHGEAGLFPAYYGGAYQLKYGTLILSRGLGNGTIIPRINNDPELVFIDVISK